MHTLARARNRVSVVAPGQRSAYGTDQLQFGELRVPAGKVGHLTIFAQYMSV